MLFWRDSGRPQGPIFDWLLENKQQIREGTAEYMGTTVNDATEFVQYKYVISLCVVTLGFTTAYDLPTAENGYLWFTRWRCSIISSLLGWWGFPWGPLYTIEALAANSSGGQRRTAASLLQLLEHGWDAPDDASVAAHRKDIIELTDSAAEEIRSRMATGGFSNDVAVRITPTKQADSKVQITFDYPISDGRDWVDESQGLLLLVDKADEAKLAGCQIDVCDGSFVSISASKALDEAAG